MQRSIFAGATRLVLATLLLVFGPMGNAVAGIAYGYDDLGRLTCASLADGTFVKYQYDNAGNRSQQAIGATSCPVGPQQPPVANQVTWSVPFNASATQVPLNITGGIAASVAIPSGQGPTHGTATVTGATISYQPTTGYSGPDAFYYTATNSFGTSPSAQVNISVGVQAPVANNSSANVVGGSTNNPIPLNITGGSATSIAVTQAPVNGTYQVNGATITYTPTVASGSDTFRYTASNSAGTSTAATVTITITAANSAPTAVADGSLSSPLPVPNGAVNFPIYALANDTDPDAGDTLRIVGRTDPATHSQGGSTNVAGNAYLLYTPPAGYIGPDQFQYTIDDGNVSHQSTATVYLYVNAAPPVANNSSATVAYNSSGNAIALNITGGAATSVTITIPTSHGTATANGAAITYTPTSGYSGSDSFTYTATNSGGTSAAATVSITVNGQLPVANAVSAGVVVNTTAPITLNITGGAATGVAVATQAAHGTATASGTTISYTPNTDYAGSDSFTYTASNTFGTSAAANASITVAAATPAPTAVNDTVTVAFNSTSNHIDALANDLHPNNYPNVIIGRDDPSHGTSNAAGNAYLLYTPTSGYSGPDSFHYTLSDQHGNQSTATVNITVSVQSTVAGDVSASVAFNSTSNPITLNVSGGAATSVAVGTGASHGTATANGTSITYTPTNGYSGADSFTYTATNSSGTSAPGTVSITVTAQPPVANAVSATVAYNATNAPIALNVTGGAPTSVAVASQGTHGVATANGTSIAYTPTSGYSGADSFTYTATNNGGTSAAATVSVTVSVQTPVANAVSAGVIVNTPTPINLSITGGTATSVAVGSQATHGTATANGTSITYTPNTDYAGADSFTYTASNTGGTSAAATATITVSAAAVAPHAVDDYVTVAYGTTDNHILALSNDTDSPYNYPLVITGRNDPSHGTNNIAGNAYLLYSPAGGYYGQDSFNYWISDQHGNQVMGTVHVTVNPPPPTVGTVNQTVAGNSSNNTITLNLSGAAATGVAVYSAPDQGGTATPNGLSISYTPRNGFSGVEHFSYTASNVGGTSGSAVANITVTTAPVTHVSPNPSWGFVYATGPNSQPTVTGYNTAQTISGINVPITLQFSANIASGAGLFLYNKNGTGWTSISNGSTIVVNNNDTLAFGASRTATDGTSQGTISIVNQSDGNMVIGQFDYTITKGTANSPQRE